MKGLFLTDIYMAMKYCRAYVLLTVVFLAVSFFGSDTMFFVLYPVLLAGMLPVTLLGYSERFKWNRYCDLLPVTRRQYVTEKYLFSGGLLVLVLLLVMGTHWVREWRSDSFDLVEYELFLLMAMLFGFVSPSVILPCIFKWGSEKGKIAYYVIVGLSCSFLPIQEMIPRNPHTGAVTLWSFPSSAIPCAVILCMLLFAGSWWISVKVYEKRELD